MSQNNSLNARQSAAAAALLTGLNQEEAAAAAGVSRATLVRWQRRPAFRAALQEGQAAALEAAARGLVDRLARALAVTEEILVDKSAAHSVRLAAARLLLDAAAKYHELAGLEARLTELERWRDDHKSTAG